MKLNILNLEVVAKLFGSLTKSDFILMFLALNVFFTVGLAFKSAPAPMASSDNPCPTGAYVSAISTQLTDVERKLMALTVEIKKPKKDINIDAVNHGVNRLSGSVSELLSNNENKVRDIVNQSTNQINQTIGDLSKQVTGIKQAKKEVIFLTDKSLPFKVLAIDSVQDEGVVDVNYLYRTLALETDDVLAGWTLKEVDYLKQKAVFENPKHELVKVHLKRSAG